MVLHFKYIYLFIFIIFFSSYAESIVYFDVTGDKIVKEGGYLNFYIIYWNDSLQDITNQKVKCEISSLSNNSILNPVKSITLGLEEKKQTVNLDKLKVGQYNLNCDFVVSTITSFIFSEYNFEIIPEEDYHFFLLKKNSSVIGEWIGYYLLLIFLLFCVAVIISKVRTPKEIKKNN